MTMSRRGDVVRVTRASFAAAMVVLAASYCLGGCKGGTQYKPDVLCQYQSPTQAVPVKISLVP